MPDPAAQRFIVEPADAGVRLQQFIARRFWLSLNQTNQLLESGAVSVDGRTARREHKGLKLQARQVIDVAVFERPAEWPARANAELAIEILAADDAAGWVVANKPAGMPVHPLEANEANTVLNALIARYPQMHGVGDGGLRSGVVHRLDVETSGTLLFATKHDTWQRLRQAFREHRITKCYHAIVQGRIKGAGERKLHLVIAQHKPAKVRVVDAAQADRPGVRLCDLRWRAIEPLRDATLVEVDLGTGFLHQIRATFAHLSHPIVGDRYYGGAGSGDDKLIAARPMLHAHRLRLEQLNVSCPYPADFTACLKQSRPADA